MEKTTHIRLDIEKKKVVTKIAESLGYTYGGKGSLSKLLEAIADNELIIVKNFSKNT